MTTLCPGSVSTDFQARAGIKPGLEHKILSISASDVAQAGYRGLMANKRAVLPSLGTKFIPSLLRFFPRGFVLAVVTRSTATAQIRFHRHHNGDAHITMPTRSRSIPDHLDHANRVAVKPQPHCL